MQNGRGIHELHVVLGGDGAGLGELGGVQGDGLLAQYVLTRGERSAQLGDVRVVRRGDVDGVDGRVGVELLKGVVHALHVVGGSEGLGL